NDGLRQHSGADWSITSLHCDVVSASAALCLNQELITSWNDQETSFSASVLNGRAHETLDQFFENHLARDCLRDLAHRRQIYDFGRHPDCASRRRDQRFLFEMRI